jgi:hypothetical protein
MTVQRAEKSRISKRPGTHRGHNKVFLPVPRTPSSASVFLSFVRVTFSHPAFTAVTRVQTPSGTPRDLEYYEDRARTMRIPDMTHVIGSDTPVLDALKLMARNDVIERL